VTAARTADVVVVGSGVAGLLTSRELIAGGREILLVERGGLKPHADQLADGSHAIDADTAEENHETSPGAPEYPWRYVYGVGGTSLHWTGVATRLLPADLELHSRYGVGADWPVSYEELAPFWAEAERELAVAGGTNPLLPGTDVSAQPAHPFSPVDDLVAPLLEPYAPLPQARPTLPVDGRPACCGSAQCELCPVDARYSGLHTWDRELEAGAALELLERTIAVRVRHHDGQSAVVECVDERGEPSEVAARAVVLAAGGIENAGLLLRSGLGGSEVGHRLYDHEQRPIAIDIGRPAGHGRGTTLSTGVSYAYADGPFRDRRASLLVYPYNPGLGAEALAGDVLDGILAGRTGPELQAGLRARFDHTLLLSVTSDDLPDPARAVSLSPRKDRFGIPLNRIEYAPRSAYVDRAWSELLTDLERRLAPLEPGAIREGGPVRGGHQLGTCPMGVVVDADLRVQGTGNVFAVGGSAFPAYGAGWPTLTIAALAIRLGRMLAST
jgi:choline dehydrogenase-like flavoprotein